LKTRCPERDSFPILSVFPAHLSMHTFPILIVSLPTFHPPSLYVQDSMLPIYVHHLTYTKVTSIHVNRLFEQNSQIIYHKQFVSHPPWPVHSHVRVFNYVRTSFSIKQANLCVPPFQSVRQLGACPYQSSKQLCACALFNLSVNLGHALFNQVSNFVCAPFLLRKEYPNARPFSPKKENPSARPL
jgi:hypothetical protein